MKQYDREYFDRWYRHPRHRVRTPEGLARKVHLAVSTAEFLLARPIRIVLDVGCGEGAWFPALARLRRGIRYIGVESSEYVLRRFGARRHIRRGTLGGLGDVRLPSAIDLIVCSDVLQYVDDDEVERGLREIRRLLGGVAYIEAFAAEDAMEGDKTGWHDRPGAVYRAMFERAGLVQCGPHCYVDPRAHERLDTFERCQG
jgi:SAM-dependent methyltransferase